MPIVTVVGDAHVDEHQTLDRFDCLNKYLKHVRPNYVITIGDFLSMNCLSDWDKNKRLLMETRRYSLEVDAGNEALDRMCKGLPKKTRLVAVKGNHENRVDRYFETDPTFLGTNSLEKDLHYYKRGFEVTEYKEHYYVNGVAFTHIPITSGGKSIGNPYVAAKALKLYGTSVVFGHTHTLDHCAEHRHGSPHLNQSLSVGCFFEHIDLYAQGSLTNYWRGIVTLNIYSENRFDIDTIAMSRLKAEYK